MRSPTGPRPLAPLLGTCVLVAGIAAGALQAAPASRPPASGPRVPAPTPPAAVGWRAERLPPGVRVDPSTLELVGLDLAAEGGAVPLAWDTLRAYEYEEGLRGLPEGLAALDGQAVTLAGFLLPLYEWTDIREFHLVASHWSCCFGVPPGISGWVHVNLAPGQAGLPNTTHPIVVTGTFRVREQKEAGYVISIWGLEAARARVLTP